MSESVDPWQSPEARSRPLAVFVVGAPPSPIRFVLVQWAVLSLQLVVIGTGILWVSPALGMLLALIVVLAPLRWMSGLRAPSAQLRWEPGRGPRLSGKFRERYLPLTRPVVTDAVDLREDRLVFDVPAVTPAGSAERFSIDAKAFRRVAADDLRALFAAVLAGDGAALASIAQATGLKLRDRPNSRAIVIAESRGTHLVSIAGTLGILAIAYACRHLLQR